MSDIVSWWSACCAFTVMLLLGTVLLGRFVSVVRIVFKATYSFGHAKAIGELASRGRDRCDISSTLINVMDICSQVSCEEFSILFKFRTRVRPKGDRNSVFR